MPIADPRYLLLLVPVVVLFHLLPGSRSRIVLLLVASYAYYATFPIWFLPLLIGMSAFGYATALIVERVRETRALWPVVAVVVIGCLTPMVLFKALSVAPVDPWIYPVGLSFYTFVVVAYVVDVALDVADAERRPHRIALATGFFPVVALGPLLRTPSFGRLDFRKATLDRRRLIRGFSEILLGMALKVGFADVLATSSDAVYAHVHTSSGLELFAGSAVELWQIYADWQSYALIAIGSARLFGIDFPPAFPQPYLSTTIGDFWRRWGVPLVNWFRDYVFTAVRLQFRTTSQFAIPVATFTTFLLFGAWHVRWGWWNYVAYGAVNGLLLIYSQQTLAARNRIWRLLGVSLTTIAPFRIAATFFVLILTVPLARAYSMSDALHIYRMWLTGWLPDSGLPLTPHIDWPVVLPLIAIMLVADIVVARSTRKRAPIPVWLQVPVLCGCVAVIVWHAVSGQPVTPFVYYRF